MDKKHLEIIEKLVAELLNKYTSYIKTSKDEFEYCSVVTAAVVFKELALSEFKQSLIDDSEEGEDPNDICELVEERAAELAKDIRTRVLSDDKLIN